MHDLVSVSQAAAMLGVSGERVRQLVNRGDLSAERIGRELLLPSAPVRDRADARPSGGRPLSPHMAWALMCALERAADLSSMPASSEQLARADSSHPSGAAAPRRSRRQQALRRAVSAVADRRLRHRVLLLLDRDAVDPDQLRQMLRRRGKLKRFHLHPSLIDPLLADRAVHAGGDRAAAAHGLPIGLSSNQLIAYVPEGEMDRLASQYLLEPDLRGELHLWAVPNEGSDMLPPPGEAIGAGAAALDLIASSDARARHAGQSWLEQALAAARGEA